MAENEFSPVIEKKKKSSGAKKTKAADVGGTNVGADDANTANIYAADANSTEQNVQQNENVTFEVAFQNENVGANGEPLPKRKHGLKPFAFFAGIFNILLAVGLVVFLVMLIPMFEGMLSGGGSSGGEALGNVFLGILLIPFFIAFMIIGGIGALIILITGILSIVSSFVSDKHNWNAWLVTAAIFDILIMLFAVLVAIAGAGSASVLVSGLAVALLSLMGAIFNFVDVGQTKKRLKEYQHKVQVANNAQTFEVEVSVDNSNENDGSNEQK